MLDQLTTTRLRARRIRATDLPYVILTDTDTEMVRWTYGTVSSRDESEQRLNRWLREEREGQLGFWIFSNGADDIGHGGLFRSVRVEGEIELGYALRPQYWGKGYATEMAHALVDVARKLALPRLIAITMASNGPSQRVLVKCAFSPDGEHVASDGARSPRYLLAIT